MFVWVKNHNLFNSFKILKKKLIQKVDDIQGRLK